MNVEVAPARFMESRMAGTPAKVAIVDDHPLFRTGLIEALNASGQFNVIAEGKDANDALRIAREKAPDAILLDLNLPGSGISAATQIVEQVPNVRVVILTVCETEEVLAQCIDAGVSGYILKGVSGDELIRVVRQICDGDVYITPALATRLLSKMRHNPELMNQNPIGDLTSRETDVLKLVAEGCTNRDIADRLDLSEKTVKHHMTRVMQKLRVKTRVEAALAYRKQQA